MDESIFIVCMVIHGLITRINFIARFGPSLNVDINTIDVNEKYLQTKLGVMAFTIYVAVLIWGFINIFWMFTLFIMIGGLVIGGMLVTDGSFKRIVGIKPVLEFSIILISLYLWRESIFLIFK